MPRAPLHTRLLAGVLALAAFALIAPASGLAADPSAGSTATGADPSTPVTTTTTTITTTTTTTPEGTTSTPAAATPAEQPTSTSGQAPALEGPDAGEARPPEVSSKRRQRTSASGSHKRSRGRHHSQGTGQAPATSGPRAKHPAPPPSTLTPALPFSLQSPFGGLPDFFIESFQIPPFLLPIFQAAGTAYGIPWQVLAAINEVETDYGRDLSVSDAGAEGWMQFLPAEWTQYGLDANGDGWEDPYNPADAIFAAARYLRAAGGDTNIKAAVYAYNHSQSYVESVMLRAQLLGATPSELLGAITGLTEARFPVHAPSHYSDGFPTVAASAPGASGSSGETLVGTTIYSQAGAPVIAVQDGEVVQIGDSPSLGRFVELRDAYGNTYVYAELGEVASEYPVLEPRVHTASSARIAGADGTRAKAEAPPRGPATAGAQPHSPLSEGALVSGLAFGAAAGLEATPPASTLSRSSAARPPVRPKPAAHAHVFSEGANDVYLHPLVPGVQVIAGTVLGRVGAEAGSSVAPPPGAPSLQEDRQAGEAPHIVFQIRPAGVDAPLIDPKPILDGWVALEDTSIFRAKGENPFLATSPTVGQVLLESKQQLEPQVLRDSGIHLGRCARADAQEGRVDKRVLAVLEYLSVSGLHPTVAGLPCTGSTPAAAAYAPASASSDDVSITAVNGIPIAGHQGPGSIADQTVRKLLMLQGLSRPQRIVSLMSYPGAAAAVDSPRAADAIKVVFGALGARGARTAALSSAGLTASEWIELIDRLGEIPDPTVPSGHSSAAIPDAPTAGSQSTEGEAGGND